MSARLSWSLRYTGSAGRQLGSRVSHAVCRDDYGHDSGRPGELRGLRSATPRQLGQHTAAGGEDAAADQTAALAHHSIQMLDTMYEGSSGSVLRALVGGTPAILKLFNPGTSAAFKRELFAYNHLRQHSALLPSVLVAGELVPGVQCIALSGECVCCARHSVPTIQFPRMPLVQRLTARRLTDCTTSLRLFKERR